MTARITLPPIVRLNAPCEVKLSILHPMETGMRRAESGALVPRNVIETLTVSFQDEILMSGAIGSGVAANPFFAFTFNPPREGLLIAEWIDTLGARGRASVAVKATG